MHFRSIHRVDYGLGSGLRESNRSSDLAHNDGRRGQIYKAHGQRFRNGPAARYEVLQLLIDTRKDEERFSKYTQTSCVVELGKIKFVQSRRIAELSSPLEDLEHLTSVACMKRKLTYYAEFAENMNIRQRTDQELSYSQESLNEEQTVVKLSKAARRRHRRKMMKIAFRLRKEFEGTTSDCGCLPSTGSSQAQPDVFSSSDKSLEAKRLGKFRENRLIP